MISQVRLYKEHYNDDLMQHHLQTDQPEVPKEILDILEEDSGYSEEKEEEYEIDQMDDSMMYWANQVIHMQTLYIYPIHSVSHCVIE